MAKGTKYSQEFKEDAVRYRLEHSDTPRQRKKLEKDTYWFNITDEGAAESNVAIIGMQKLFNGVIYESDGTIKEMEKNFFELIEKVWEVS